MKLSNLKAPNTFFIIFSIIIIVAISTWFIPAGEFERKTVNGKSVVINETFHYTENNPQGISAILQAPIKGFVDAALIIGFVLIVGGAFSVFQKTEAVDSGIKAITKAYHKSKLVEKLLIPILMILFSLGGAIFGMAEEIIPFILILVPLTLSLGYDSITAVAIAYVGSGVGFAGAFLNPFTVGIAQGIADVPLFSGIEYRIVVWLIVTIIAIIFVTRYAEKIKKNPKLSPVYELDKNRTDKFHIKELQNFSGIDKQHKIVLVVFLLGLIFLVVGVLNYGWFIEEICATFLITGILVGIFGKLSIKEITDSFVQGAKDLIGTALIIALARGILIVASDGKIIDTILYALSEPIRALHPIVSSQTMFFVQTAINFFVPSGSGQAALTMPIMAPLGDLVGVTRQTAILAYQFGDGFSNLIIPTSAVTMGVLTLAEIPWEKWARWISPLMVILIFAGMLLLIPPYFLNWQ